MTIFPRSAYCRDMKIGVAELCAESTARPDRQETPFVHSLIEINGLLECIARNTRVDLSVESIRTFKNKYHSWSVEMAITPDSNSIWSKVEKRNLNKGIVLLRGDEAVFRILVVSTQEDGKLNLIATDESEAKLITNALSGE
jgi:hypothetical protein